MLVGADHVVLAEKALFTSPPCVSNQQALVPRTGRRQQPGARGTSNHKALGASPPRPGAGEPEPPHSSLPGMRPGAPPPWPCARCVAGGKTGGRGGRAGAEIWGKARSPGPNVSQGTPDAVPSGPPPPRRAAPALLPPPEPSGGASCPCSPSREGRGGAPGPRKGHFPAEVGPGGGRTGEGATTGPTRTAASRRTPPQPPPAPPDPRGGG